ncbi:MAG: hypothetical protein HBSIN02_04370 [Bacteroidia bacterium]|nr:MAG: hypothetical protein HBSIN02_04370 [Bacteroidia bacterium]
MKPHAPLASQVTNIVLEPVEKAAPTLNATANLGPEQPSKPKEEPKAGNGRCIVQHRPETSHESARRDQVVLWS